MDSFNFNRFKVLVFGAFILSIGACTTSKEERAKKLYNVQCASCHLLPSPKDLPKEIWRTGVLPEMAARMGIRDSNYNPFAGRSFGEREQMIRSGVYNTKPSLSKKEWTLLKDYIIQMAPDSLTQIPTRTLRKDLSLFNERPINLDSVPGSSISFLDVAKDGTVMAGNLRGNLLKYDYKKNRTVKKTNYGSLVTWYNAKDNVDYITMVGILDPSERKAGLVYKDSVAQLEQVAGELHRPVHTSVYDFNGDGKDEIIISEFGNLTGVLSLWYLEDSVYKKKVLFGQPGVIRTIVKDMNGDGKADIVLLSTQGNEGITILYQTSPLSFKSDTVIRFNPVYGSSWFDLVDYDGDGDDDIITVNGDNGDKSFVNKPYHGMRIHINDGSNNFEEKFFFPMYGATRFTANDFDEDGDIDVAIVSSFPDYEKNADFSFVYLENIVAENFEFNMFGLKDPSIGRWLLIASNDMDGDGDKDIVLSAFSYYFTPVPDDLFKFWNESNVDLMVLENTLK